MPEVAGTRGQVFWGSALEASCFACADAATSLHEFLKGLDTDRDDGYIKECVDILAANDVTKVAHVQRTTFKARSYISVLVAGCVACCAGPGFAE